MGIGKSIHRVDAVDKVTGVAQYTDDICRGVANLLVAKVVRSTIANGLVKSFDLSEAEKVPGVVKILTCFDSPDYQFPTAGHPWSVDKSHQDVADRKLLNTRVRVYGDDIGVVIAEDEVVANRAARLVKVEYEEYPVYTTPFQAMEPDAVPLHPDVRPDNILVHSNYKIGDGTFAEASEDSDLIVMEKEYTTQTVQHCHIEVPLSYAYMEKGRVIVVSSTQIPHIVRRVTSQATGLPFGKIRIIKPYIGGGFGNKQEVLYEPLNAWLTTQVGGRPVKLELSREETLACTRVRHAIDFKLKTAVRADGTLVARKLEAFSNQGAYASHGHSIVANSVTAYRHNYKEEKVLEADAYTVYSNITPGGAMRGYGIPQIIFAQESHMDDLAAKLGMDPIEFRMKNSRFLEPGYVDPMNGITCYTSGLRDCLQKGMEAIGWKEKREKYKDQTGSVRRGVGMSLFSYKTGVYPISLETSSCRMVLNQDGSAQLQMGATEIGQGADTVFTQMAAETLGFTEDKINIISTQDTDITPFDTGAYASRQTYVSGMALKKTALLLRERILEYAAEVLKKPSDSMDIRENVIVDAKSGDALVSMDALAIEAFYSLDHSVHITAESTNQCRDNTFALGVCFAEVEVDIPLGKVKVLNIINVHDSGILMNPKLAEAQVHGGMSMGLGYALGEALLYDAKGRPLNDNLLDYKLPTSLDTPELDVDFVETQDPSAPYGNKALGEPPAIPPAPAVRNAVLHATGVSIDSLPMNPQKLVEKFTVAGLIKEVE